MSGPGWGKELELELRVVEATESFEANVIEARRRRVTQGECFLDEVIEFSNRRGTRLLEWEIDCQGLGLGSWKHRITLTLLFLFYLVLLLFLHRFH